MDLYTLRERRCGLWDWSRDLRGQEGFAEHAGTSMEHQRSCTGLARARRPRGVPVGLAGKLRTPQT